ncbi:M35 family metallo-endopeptidase [Thiohalocapsa sp. ML1]|uniref:M35 family metallo-endopeptidase n=1 Tax=Thiohalocapsa sp. ML1 TaxID=1431688 RepID=UPI0009E8BFB2|nr:M35 family metallo-endopeptidase [Thiohalocapsa sp. ML1]
MNVYTEVYNKCRQLCQVKALAADWKDIESGLKSLLEANGPSVADADVLDKLRERVDSAASWTLFRSNARAEAIVAGAQPGKNGFQDRAALLKSMYHFYLVSKAGGQSIWVVDHPTAYGKWVFDVLSGKSADSLKVDLKDELEVFGGGNRKMMSESVQLARKWSADVEVALGGRKDDVRAKVERWFLDGSSGDLDVTIAKLAAGFRKITASCNSNAVIFADRPHLRASGDYDSTFASVNAGDSMPVIYIYQLFLKTGRRDWFGNIPKLWLCALTVIHELSHKLVSTDDIKYDYEGLKPGPGFTSDQALKNADSWAYFAADVVGALSKGTLNNTLV